MLNESMKYWIWFDVSFPIIENFYIKLLDFLKEINAGITPKSILIRDDMFIHACIPIKL